MKQLGSLDPDTVVWRYRTFRKYASLIQRRALWFSKLEIFEDMQEGKMPELARSELKRQHRDMEKWFPDEDRKRQVRQFVATNEEDGRELIVASCWFIGERESLQMWTEYAKDDQGVAIKTTVRDLIQSLELFHNECWIGKVNYVDITSHEQMNAYEAHQACLRVFVKSEIYSHEKELRVATMNWVTYGCLNPDGSPPSEKQLAGYMYSPDRAGILVKANLPTLIKEIRSAPKSSGNHRENVEFLAQSAGVWIPVQHSEFS